MERETLARRLERALAEEAAIDAIVECNGQVATLTGRVASAEQRQAAEDIIRRIAPDLPIDNDLDIETTVPENLNEVFRDEPTGGLIPDELAGPRADDLELAADFTNQPLVTDPAVVLEVGEEAYFAPTDPVITIADDGDIEVLGGLTPTADDDVTVAPSVLDGQPGDEAIAEAVRRELREDAATTALRLEVGVRNGIVVLRGPVEGPEDAENAEAVAARVPGVVEVIDETVVR